MEISHLLTHDKKFLDVPPHENVDFLLYHCNRLFDLSACYHERLNANLRNKSSNHKCSYEC